MGKYLDKTGLSRLWSKIKAAFIPKNGAFVWTLTGNTGDGFVEFGDTYGDIGILIKNGTDEIRIDSSVSGSGIIITRQGEEIIRLNTETGITVQWNGTDEMSSGLHFVMNGVTYSWDMQTAEQLRLVVRN